MTEREQQAYQDGQDAYRKGFHPSTNPYAGRYGVAMAWQRGWNVERDTQREPQPAPAHRAEGE